MTWIAKFLGIDKWLVGAIAIALAASLVLFAGHKVYDGIYDRGYGAAAVKYEAQIAAERAALAEANANEQRRQAIANNAAKKREADALAALEQAESANQELRRKLASEAKQDPDAGRIAVGAGGVQRINKIR